MRSCGDCKFYNETQENVGECRRNPPTAFMFAAPSGPPILGAMGKANATGIRFSFPAAWPLVQSIHWCGHFDVAGPDERPEKAVGVVGLGVN